MSGNGSRGSARSTSDRRVHRTHRALTDAMSDLVLDRPYERISVREILDRADVGRSTFYEHFRHKDELLVRAMAPLLDALASAASCDDDTAALEGMLHHFAHQRAAAAPLMHDPAVAHFREAMTAELARRVDEIIGRDAALSGRGFVIPRDIALQQIAGSIVQWVARWVHHATACEPGPFASAMARSVRAQVEALHEPVAG